MSMSKLFTHTCTSVTKLYNSGNDALQLEVVTVALADSNSSLLLCLLPGLREAQAAGIKFTHRSKINILPLT